MWRFIFIFLGILSRYICQSQSSQAPTSPFHFTEEARAQLCPFVGYEGLRCFDNHHIRRSGRQFDSGIMKLPRGVGMSVDQITGEIKALAVQLTYTEEGTRVWTDSYTGNMYDTINEITLGPASRILAAFDASRVHIFQNASQLDAVWRQRFVDGKIRGGELAHRPDMLEYSNEYFKNDKASAISQRAIGLYTLRVNASTIKLNSFAHHAHSHLTELFDPKLYEAFIDVWGTHIVTQSLIGGMIEERANVPRCYRSSDHAMFARCIPFRSRQSIHAPGCAYYAAQARVISRRHLGGSVDVDAEDEWKKTLAAAPALLQILETVPWYDFITNPAVKKNLQSAIEHRQKTMDLVQAEAVRQVDARLSSCTSAPFGLAYIKVNASWNKNGITVAGGNGAGGSLSQLNWPHGLFMDDDDDTLYIADMHNDRIVELRVRTGWARVVVGGNGRGSAANQLNHPHDMIVDRARDTLLIADNPNHRIVQWSLQGAKSGETIIKTESNVVYLTMDEVGSIYASFWLGDQLRKWQYGETSGTVVAGGNGVGSNLNQLNNPRKFFVDRNRSVYVCEWDNHRVTKWVEGAKEGIIVAGGNGQGNSLSQFRRPDGIIVDQFETLYIADRYNHRIMRWTKGAREGQVILGGMGPGSQPNQLHEPIGLAFDRHGNLFVTDAGNHRVQKFEIL